MKDTKRTGAKSARPRIAPEPKDKLSPEWRAWKLRQIRRAFDDRMDDREAYYAAHDYFRELLTGLFFDENFYRVDFILSLLPHLIEARQELDEIDRRERRMRAGMKGAERNRAKLAAVTS